MTLRWTTAGQKTVPQFVREAREKWPDKVFLDFKGEKYTYAEVDDLSTQMAHGLMALDVGRGVRAPGRGRHGRDVESQEIQHRRQALNDVDLR